MRNDMLKIVLAACLATIGTGSGAWLVFGQDKVTRSDMAEYFQSQILVHQVQIGQNAEHIGELKGSVDTLVRAQTELLVEQRVLVQRFDDYLEHQADQ